jgi:uncharacterized RDD family membrane protein YckC
VLAIIVDGILLSIVGGVLSLPSGLVGLAAGEDGGGAAGGISSALGGLAGLLTLVLAFAYYTFMEGRYGQTLGKMALGIQVIREDTGLPPGFGGAALRTVLRIVDQLPFAYIVGFIAIQVSDKNQRLGDMVAKTLVVRA